jgi:hypothetical protein
MAENNASFDWKAFSRKPWVIVVSGLVIPPIGILLAWLKPDWTSKKKWLATGLMTLLIIGRYNASSSVDQQQGAEEVVSADGESETTNRSVSRSTPASNASGDVDEDPEYQEGYRYVSEILAAAKRAPPSMKKQIMQPLRDLAEEAEQGSSKRSRRFFKGASKAMDDLLQDVLKDIQ